MAQKRHDLIVVSDLHLSSGWDSRTGRLSRHEDFFFDDAFSRFLQWLNEESRRRTIPWRLVLAGDIVDFLQVTDLPRTGTFPLRPAEVTYGLGTSPEKTIWKLGRILEGHPVFFRALSSFLAAGHDVALVTGNHDIEWNVPPVRAAFVEQLVGCFPKGREAGQRIMAEQLRFHPWFYAERPDIWVEHGHVYDGINAFDYLLYPWLPNRRELLLPAGSFFVRYLFNCVEQNDPFADNIKPVGAYLRRYAWKRLWRRDIRAGLRQFLQILQKIRRLSPGERVSLASDHDAALADEASRTGIPVETLQRLRTLWEPCLLYNSGLRANLSSFLASAGDDRYGPRASAVARAAQVSCVVFGHTHTADLRRGPEGTLYVNAGSWCRSFCANPTEALIAEAQGFPFVRMRRREDGSPSVTLMNWRDDLGTGERLRLFAD